MKKRLFLISLAVLTLLSASMVDARNQHGNHYNRQDYHKYSQQKRDYYPQKPQYPHSPIQAHVASGVLGSVLGYEIAKGNPVVSELGAATGSFLENPAPSKKH